MAATLRGMLLTDALDFGCEERMTDNPADTPSPGTNIDPDGHGWAGPADRIATLLAVMARLRDPVRGCPWDVEQTFATIAPYTLEEAYEVADAIDREAFAELPGELGDLLLQVVFHAQIAAEAGLFDFGDVCRGIVDKMIRRHPHVFGDQGGIDSAAAQTANWEDLKASERARAADGREGVLDGIATALPGLLRALKLQKRAARVGFDWPDIRPVMAKVHEELGEVEAELADGDDPQHLEEEIGDLLFAVANLARHRGIDPEAAMRRANAKFERRFRQIETAITAEGQDLRSASLEDMERHWVTAKARERR